MTKKQIIRLILLIFIFEFIQYLMYFRYNFFAVGWDEALARKIILFLSILTPLILLFSYKFQVNTYANVILLLNGLFFIVSLIFALFKPFVLSQGAYDLFSVKTIYILNPAISLSYIIYISTTVLLILKIKSMGFKKIFLIFIPVLLWILLRIFFNYIETPTFHG